MMTKQTIRARLLTDPWRWLVPLPLVAGLVLDVAGVRGALIGGIVASLVGGGVALITRPR